MDGRAVQLLLCAGREEVRLRHQPDLDHARSAQKRVDFSDPYFEAPQAVIAPAGLAGVRTRRRLAALQDAKIGVQVGTTSLDAVNATIKPKQQPQVFNDSNDTVRALKGKRVDAIVVDLPTAFYLVGAEVEDAKIVGQFAAPGGDKLGPAAGQGLRADAVRQRGARQARSPRASWTSCSDQWMGGEAAPPLS